MVRELVTVKLNLIVCGYYEVELDSFSLEIKLIGFKVWVGLGSSFDFLLTSSISFTLDPKLYKLFSLSYSLIHKFI